MPQGTLRFTVRTADSAFPITEARVTVSLPDGTVLGEDRVTAQNGAVSRDFLIDAPDRALSLRPEETQPYSTVDATISASGFYTFVIRGIQIFAGERKIIKIQEIFFETDDFKSDIMIMAEFGQNKIERNKFNIR